MSTAGTVFFVFCALVALLSAVATVMFRNPIRAAMGLMVHVLALAGLYLSLHAHLIAALQLIVYAGAIVVLFVFVIMLLGPSSAHVVGATRGLLAKTFGVGLMALVTSAVAFVLIEYRPRSPEIAGCPPGAGAECNQFGGVGAVASELYKEGVVPFELISILLLVGILGAIAVARGRSAEELERLRRRRAQREGGQQEPDQRLGAEASAQSSH